ncbi:retrovirus-related pol polyprotein from transposon TNT 1-94, partial [Tanacetum coccineum]
QFYDGDLEVAFRSKTCFVQNLEGDDLLTGDHESNLYIISIFDMAASSPVCLMSKATSTKSWLWHPRLSHLSFGTINDLTKHDLVDGLLKFKYGKDHLCFACEQGKSKKVSHPPKVVPSNHSKLELLHINLCGPMRVASINGKQYILVIVDDYSRFAWVYFLRTKDETPEIIKNFIAQVQLNYNAKVCKIRTDNGTEFKNANLKARYDKIPLGRGSFHRLLYSKSVYNSYKSINSAAQQVHNHEDSPSTSLIIIEEHEAPPIVTTSKEQTSPISLNEADDFNQEEYVDFDGNTVFVPYDVPNFEEAESSTTALDPSNMHEFHQVQPSTHTWTKSHPLEQVIGDPSKPVMTRQRFQTDSEVCMYALTVSTIEPKNIKEAIPDGKNIIAVKWLWKNKSDAENIIIRNKSCLIVKGYKRGRSIDFELVDRIRSRINDWKNKSLSAAERLQLVRSVLGSMHVYWASVFILPSCILLDIEQLMRGFLWCHGEMKKGRAKVAWEVVCLPKNEGGLGIWDSVKSLAGLPNVIGSILIIVDLLIPFAKRRSARSVVAKLVSTLWHVTCVLVVVQALLEVNVVFQPHSIVLKCLGHNIFNVEQFCDSDLEVAFRSKTCYVRNLEGDDLLTGDHESNLYIISIFDMAASSPVCLMSKATSTKSWLWHPRLSHLSFGTINDLTKHDLVDGLLKFYDGKRSSVFDVSRERRRKLLIHLKWFQEAESSTTAPRDPCEILHEMEEYLAVKWLWKKQKVDAEYTYYLYNKSRLIVNGLQAAKKASIWRIPCSYFSKRFANLMKNNFEMSMMGELKFFLGLQAHQSLRGIFISHSQYVIELLKKDSMDECVFMSTHMATERLDADLQGTPTDQMTYRRMIGGLMYLIASRPDIAFATFVCARYQARPTYSKDSGFELIAYSDADHAGCKDDCKSTSGGLQFLGENLVSWSSKKQDCTVMSTAEAEYVSLSTCCA